MRKSAVVSENVI